MRDRTVLSVPVAIMKSMTPGTGKKYALTLHGYVTCSCPSAAYPLPGRRYGQCKHTDAFEQATLLRTTEREQLVEGLRVIREKLRAFDGGDDATPLSMPSGWRLPEYDA